LEEVVGPRRYFGATIRRRFGTRRGRGKVHGDVVGVALEASETKMKARSIGMLLKVERWKKGSRYGLKLVL
jgi:hypothetical protein